MIAPELLQLLRGHFAIDWHGAHGVSHWARVRAIGLRLAARTGARPRVVELFAFVHDACRRDEGIDRGHGRRSAAWIQRPEVRAVLGLDDTDLALLVRACEGHSEGGTVEDVTVCTCWDADRLDLGRVGIRPQARYLCTDAARDPEMMRWAWRRSVGMPG